MRRQHSRSSKARILVLSGLRQCLHAQRRPPQTYYEHGILLSQTLWIRFTLAGFNARRIRRLVALPACSRRGSSCVARLHSEL